MRKLILLVIAALAFAGLTMGNSGCGGDNGTSSPNAYKQARSASQSRANAFAQAEVKYPDPIPQNFPLRKLLRDYTVQQDAVNHPWYVYIQAAQTGQIIAYYVATTQPLNTCSYLSNPESVVHDNWPDGGAVYNLQSPSLNGYYGGQSQCDNWVFEDTSTHAMVIIKGNSFTVMSQPLALDVPRLKVAVS